MVTMLDYGAGNVRSVINALESLGSRVKVASSVRDILEAERLVFPGVGHFASIMEKLEQKGFDLALKEYLLSGRPYLGICLGMQVLFDCSEEAPGQAGLGILPGKVEKFDILDLSVPHIGWNGFRARKPSRLMRGLSGNEKLYFVHSFHVVPEDSSVVLLESDYGVPFVSAIETGNIIATQFHPEKSGTVGRAILRNFFELDAEAVVPDRCPEVTTLAKRVIACLDVRTNDDGDLVVTKGDRYDVREKGSVRNFGKPVDLAERYYAEGADEIVFLNITAFRDFPLADLPMLEVLRRTSEKVFVPLTIGGGIQDCQDASGRLCTALEIAGEYFRSGADKVSIGSDAVRAAEDVLEKGRPTGKSSIEAISRVYGSQAVVVSIDPRRVYVQSPESVPQRVLETSVPGPNGERFCWYQCTVKGGREGSGLDAITLAEICEGLGAGEILLNCIDRDGTCGGFDLELINAVKESVTIPVIASSGAGSPEHFLELFMGTAVESALAAGIFHRGEVPIQAVKDRLAGIVEIRSLHSRA